MKSFTLKKKSLHYWLASTAGSTYIDPDIDMCAYLRKVVESALSLLAIAALALFGLYIIGHMTYSAWLCAFGTRCVFTPLDQGAGFILLCVAGVFSFVGLFLVRKELKARYKAGAPKDPGFLVLAWRSVKDKTCFKIEFKD